MANRTLALTYLAIVAVSGGLSLGCGKGPGDVEAVATADAAGRPRGHGSLSGQRIHLRPHDGHDSRFRVR